MSEIKPGTPHAIGYSAGLNEIETHVQAVPPPFAFAHELHEWQRGYSEALKDFKEDKKNA